MKILHLANWNSTNIGNGALIWGTEKILKEDLKDVEFIAEPWDNYTFGLKKFDQTFVDLVNTTSDALMVNGAVTFNAFRKFTKNTGMRFDLPLELWDKITKPIIFYGISYRCWPNQVYPNKDALKKTIEYALSKDTIFFGVRNDGTKEWIKRTLGIDSEKIYEVPDPGLFATALTDQEYPEINKEKKNVFIAFNNEDDLYRFGGQWRKKIWDAFANGTTEPLLEKLFLKVGAVERNRARMLKKLARAVETLAQEYDAQFILCVHYLDDYDMVGEFISYLNERVAHQLTVSTGLLKVPHTPYFYGRYKQADLILGMRVHSMSPAIGLSAPIIPLTSQGRMVNFLSKAGLLDIAVNIFADTFEADLLTKARKLLDDSHEYKARLTKAVRRMREQAEVLNKNQVQKLLTK